MSSTFTLTVADFARFQKLLARRFRAKAGLFSAMFGLRVLVWFSIGLAGATYARLLRENPEISRPLYIVAALLIVALVAVVSSPYLAHLTVRKHMLAPTGAFLSPQTVSLSPAVLRVSSATGTTEVPWSGLLARDEDEANYYFFIDVMQAVILPRNAVTSFEAELKQFTANVPNAV